MNSTPTFARMEWPSEDDPELHALHKERIQQMKEEQEKRKVMESKGHGTYADVNEGEFLPEVTGAVSGAFTFATGRHTTASAW